MKLYLSGKITGDANYKEKFHSARIRLEDAGFEVVNPCELGLPDDVSWEQAMKVDIREMLICDAVAVLPDWIDSKGAFMEVDIAAGVGMNVKPVDAWLIS